MPAVSVIVLAYKVEEYIERCARALFEQTMQDIEYVFVDDCTPDRSMEILDKVLDDYPVRRSQVKILRNETNCGQAFSRRRGVETATGDYIIHCDSDDWPETDMYAKLHYKAWREKLDMVICQMNLVFPDHTEIFKDKLGGDDTLGALIRQDIQNHLIDKLVSRKAYEKGIVWPQSNMSEDSAMLIQLACNCDSFGYICEPLYNYFFREGSISRSLYDEDKVNEMRDNYNLAISCLEAKGMYKKYKKDIITLKCFLKSVAQPLPRTYYLDLYPEVNSAYLFDKNFSLMTRLGHLTKLLGIHGISQLLKRKKK